MRPPRITPPQGGQAVRRRGVAGLPGSDRFPWNQESSREANRNTLYRSPRRTDDHHAEAPSGGHENQLGLSRADVPGAVARTERATHDQGHPRSGGPPAHPENGNEGSADGEQGGQDSLRASLDTPHHERHGGPQGEPCGQRIQPAEPAGTASPACNSRRQRLEGCAHKPRETQFTSGTPRSPWPGDLQAKVGRPPVPRRAGSETEIFLRC